MVMMLVRKTVENKTFYIWMKLSSFKRIHPQEAVKVPWHLCHFFFPQDFLLWIIINIHSYREKYEEHPCVCCTDINILPDLLWVLLSNKILIESEMPPVLFSSFHRNNHYPGYRIFVVLVHIRWVVTWLLKKQFCLFLWPSQLFKFVGNCIEYLFHF